MYPNLESMTAVRLQEYRIALAAANRFHRLSSQSGTGSDIAGRTRAESRTSRFRCIAVSARAWVPSLRRSTA